MKRVWILVGLVLLGVSVSPLLTCGLLQAETKNPVATAPGSDTVTATTTATPVRRVPPKAAVVDVAAVEHPGIPGEVVVTYHPIPSVTPEVVNRDGVPVRLMIPQSPVPCKYFVAAKGRATKGFGSPDKPLNYAAFLRRKVKLHSTWVCHTDSATWPVNQ